MRAKQPLVDVPERTIVSQIGSATVMARNRVARMAAEKVLAGPQGKRLSRCATPQVYG
jgi:hypothetical protein